MSATNAIHSAFHSVAEVLMPNLKTSAFLSKGVLTPEEFLAAGDLLVYKCPTWSWEGGDSAKTRTNLPADKQFLITRNVPCLQRARSLQASVRDEEMVEGDDGEDWVAPQQTGGDTAMPDISSMSLAGRGGAAAAADADDDDIPEIGGEGGGDDDDDIPDIEDYEEDMEEPDDAAAVMDESPDGDDAEAPAGANIQKTRTYDISISYDRYYQTPRAWLFGYDENRQPLKPAQIFEDISPDHAKQTVTIETHPHYQLQHASIHPCKHSSVMKKIVDRLAEEGKEVRPDQYLFLFLKFLSAVIPTIEFDYTIQMEG